MSIRSYEKNNAWNIRRLVGGSLGQTNHRPSLLFYKLSDLKTSEMERCNGNLKDKALSNFIIESLEKDPVVKKLPTHLH